jgi:hypothetical protein
VIEALISDVQKSNVFPLHPTCKRKDAHTSFPSGLYGEKCSGSSTFGGVFVILVVEHQKLYKIRQGAISLLFYYLDC